MTNGRLVLPAAGRVPLGGDEISIKTGKPIIGGFTLMVERRFGALVEAAETVVKKITGSRFEERDLMSREVTQKLEELGMSGGGFQTSLSKNGAIIVKDPDGELCCIIRKTEQGIETTDFITPYILRERSGRIGTTAGLSSSF